MKTKQINRKRVVLFLSLFLLLGSVSAYSYTNVDFAISFHDSLAPYGTWVNVSHYGSVWRPRVGYGWRPYTNGYWGYSSYGPTWVGYEPYSWAVNHYGHWIYTAQFGWVWVPGYEWSPGVVDWSYGGGYIGWRPAYWGGYGGYGGYGNDYNLWVMISTDHFGYRDYSPYILRGDRVRTLFNRRAVRIDRGTLRRADLERIVRRPIRTVELKERVIRADNRVVRMRVPKDRDTTVVKQLARFNKKSEVAQVRGKSSLSKDKAITAKGRSSNTKEKFTSDRGKKSTVQKKEIDRGSTKKSSSIASKSSKSKKPAVQEKSKGRSSKSYATTSKDRSSKSSAKSSRGSTNKSDKKASYRGSSKKPDTKSYTKSRGSSSQKSLRTSHSSKKSTIDRSRSSKSKPKLMASNRGPSKTTMKSSRSTGKQSTKAVKSTRSSKKDTRSHKPKGH